MERTLRSEARPRVAHAGEAEAVAGVPAVQRRALAQDGRVGALVVVEGARRAMAELAVGSDALAPAPGEAVVALEAMHAVGGAEGVHPHDVAAVGLAQHVRLRADVLVGLDA